MIWGIVHWVGRLGLGALFLYAGYTKLRSPFLFGKGAARGRVAVGASH